MKTIEINIYKFPELSECAKERARDWWRSCASDDVQFAAENIRDDWEERGVKITSLDERRCSIEFADFGVDVAEKIAGDEYLAEEIPEAAAFVAATNDNADSSDWCDVSDDEQEAYDDFRRAIENYLVRRWCAEMEWIYSDEYIDDALTANEYEFTEGGEFYHG